MKVRHYLLPLVAMLASVAPLSAAAEENEKTANEFQGHSLSVSGGYGFILTTVKHDWKSGTPKNGWEFNAEYRWISQKNMGIGFIYSGYFASGKQEVSYGLAPASLYINYIAPEFVGKIPLRSERWSLNGAVGIGLFNTVEKGHVFQYIARNTDWGIGCNLSFGAEFKITQHLRAIGTASLIGGMVNRDFDIMTGDGSDLERISLSLGLKYQF